MTCLRYTLKLTTFRKIFSRYAKQVPNMSYYKNFEINVIDSKTLLCLSQFTSYKVVILTFESVHVFEIRKCNHLNVSY